MNQAEQDLNKKQIDSANEYQSLKADWEKQMNENDKIIEQLKEDKNDKKVATDKEYNEKIAALKKENDEMRTKANNYKYESSDTKWQEFKDGFNKEMKKLGDGITNLKNKIVKKTDKD